ncbi:hypothetical protein Pflav_070150 [Phytohabitans flavus]|uniref:Uncharacterized protein n=1 Tax=Phytohabitans flavus TaxID=1076124 RepID=A0A6F8Y3D5_9ACTN|nr:hypothetical protein [Phytohabitans flavus]BCB80605.1 hypothetical protein Pflav_070150 [Phytohabitans flavus]
MPVPDALRTLSHDPAFWADYFFRATPEADPEPAELRATFPVAGGYALVLDLDRAYGTYALGLRTPVSGEPIPMAWDDRSRWHPHGLRWPELDLVGRVVALDDPSLPTPGYLSRCCAGSRRSRPRTTPRRYGTCSARRCARCGCPYHRRSRSRCSGTRRGCLAKNR